MIKKGKQLEALGRKMEKEHDEWEALRIKAEDELDVTHISQVWDRLPDDAQKLSDMLQHDIEGLVEIIGDDFSYDDLDNAVRASPNSVLMIVRRIVIFIQTITQEKRQSMIQSILEESDGNEDEYD